MTDLSCPHAAHNARIIELEQANALLVEVNRTLSDLCATVERERDQARADAQTKTNALCEIAAMCQSLLDQDDIIDPGWVVQIAVAACPVGVGAPLPALRVAVRAYKEAVARDVLFGIADTEQAAMFAALEEAGG
jgi:hypothetical protein